MTEHTQRKTIDGYVYEVTQLGFREGRHTLTRLIHFLGPTLAKTLKGVDGGLKVSEIKNLSNIKLAVVSALIEELSHSINDDDLDHFCQIFGDTTLVSVDLKHKDNLVPLDLEHQEIHFKGEYGRFFKWLWFCLEVNYAGFTSGLTDLAARVQSRQAGAKAVRASR